MKKENTKNTSKRSVWGWVKRIFLFLFLAQLFYIILLKWVDPPITLTQLGSLIHGDGLKRDYVDGDELSYNLKLAVMASEDQVFPDHDGFDWKSINKAMKHNEKKPNRIKGASTISSKRQKMFFSGRAGVGCAKAWKCILPR